MVNFCITLSVFHFSERALPTHTHAKYSIYTSKVRNFFKKGGKSFAGFLLDKDKKQTQNKTGLQLIYMEIMLSATLAHKP